MWEIAENLHRVDLTKEERDKHIRRYAELLEKQVVPQTAAKPKSGPKGGRPKGTARIIADETGLSDDTVRRALNPQPSTVPNEEADDQERVYNNLCKWWRKAGLFGVGTDALSPVLSPQGENAGHRAC